MGHPQRDARRTDHAADLGSEQERPTAALLLPLHRDQRRVHVGRQREGALPVTGPTRLTSRHSRAVATLVLVVVTMTVGPLARGAIAAARADEQAGAPSGYVAVAEADGVRTTTVATGGPLTSVPVDVGSPVAQATFDSLGSSRAFASQAYPGDEVVTLPGTVAGVTNGAANLPHYPLIAQSDAPATPSSNVDAPGTSLRADSSSTESKASATSGAQSGDDRAGLTSSEAHIALTADGAVTASAANDAEALTFGPLRFG